MIQPSRILLALLALTAIAGAGCSFPPTPSASSETATPKSSPVPTAEAPAILVPTPSPGPGSQISTTPTLPPSPTVLAHTEGIGAIAPLTDSDPANVALGYVRELSENLGPRESGTDQERAAAEYLASRLEEFGYQAELQEFSMRFLSRERSSLTLDKPGLGKVEVIPLGRSATGLVSGALLHVGLAGEEDIPEDGMEGKIALVERGLITFSEKVTRVGEAGAIGVVIYNNRPANFQGVLGDLSVIPAVAVSQEDGERLKKLLATGEVQASISVEAENRPSQNVIAEKPGEGARVVVLGAHYDTVADVPGANDNASGTAVLLTLAQQLSQRSFPFTLRFIAFGAEELGLRGSRHYVGSLSEQQRQQIAAMLNFDSLGSGETIGVLGAPELTSKMVEAGSILGIPVRRSGGGGGGSSDHASFTGANILAIMVSSQDASRIHTPDDTLEHVNSRLLGDAVRLALSLLESPALFEKSGQ